MYSMSCAVGDLPCFIDGGEMKKNRSKFIEEITSLPFIQSAATLYCTVKEKNRLLKLTLTPFESSCTKALGILHKALPSRLESSMDEKAARCVSYAKRKYPKLKKTPREIYSDGRSKVVTTMKDAAEALAKSKPGQTVIRGLDWSIERGENLLEYLEDRSPPEEQIRHRTRNKDQLGKGKERHYASSDSGVNSEMKERSSDLVRHRGQAPREASNSEEKRVAILRKIHRFLCKLGETRAIRRKDIVVKDKPLTPEKVAEIDSRRKVSPRKRVKRSFLGAIKFAAYGFVGFRSGHILAQSTSAMKDERVSPKNIEGEKKRKFQETETEQGSDGSESEKGFKDLDLKNYNSDEDPDYVPSEESEDSLEYKLEATDEVQTSDEEKDLKKEEKDEEGKQKEEEKEEEETKEETEEEEAEEEDTEEEDTVEEGKVNGNFGKETLEPGVLEVKSDTEHEVGHDMRDDEDAKMGTDDDMVEISMENVDNSQPRIKSPVIRLAPSWKVE